MKKCSNPKKPISMRSACFAFTLIELLVVIVIITILGAITVGALRSANQDTLAAKTRATIAKIDSVLNDRVDEFFSKPIDYMNATAAHPNNVSKFPREGSNGFSRRPDQNGNYAPSGLLRERVRLAATRDLMRMEMPDCPGDLARVVGVAREGIEIDTGFLNTVTNINPVVMTVVTPQRFQRIITKVSNAIDPNGVVSSTAWVNTFANEELLYLIVEDSFYGGSPAIEAFAASEIADLDKDGLKEFIDAWGQPIRWLRWPAGLTGVMPINPDPLYSPALATDPFDPTNSDVGYDMAQTDVTRTAPSEGLKPLVASAGPDGKFGIRFQFPITHLPNGYSPTETPALFSVSAVKWPLVSGNPLRPGYVTNMPINWPDPYHPRYVNGDVFDRLYRLGAPMIIGHDAANEVDAQGILVPTDPEYRLDNVTNLDESGASL